MKKLVKSLGKEVEKNIFCETMVSICCTTYNQKEYIRDALNSFLSQKTNFTYEIIVHDDCSTDGTTDILHNYEEKYPQKIKVIYESENQYSKGIKIEPILYKECKGKYIAFCEGDDYWCDQYKLQKQFDFMEKNIDCSLTVHSCYFQNSLTGKKKQKKQPYFGSRYYTINEIITGDGGIFPTNSMFFRKQFIDLPSYFYTSPIGDLPTMMYLATVGSVYYMDEPMSVYRVNSINSWSARQLSNDIKLRKKRQEKFYKEVCLMLKEFNKVTNNKYDKAVTNLLLIKKYQYFVAIGELNKIKDKEFKKLYKIYTKREIFRKVKLFIIRNIPCIYLYLKKRI